MFYFMSAHSGEVICSQWGDIRQQQEKRKKEKSILAYPQGYERSELSWISINQSMFYFMSALWWQNLCGEVICSQWGDIRQQQEKRKKEKGILAYPQGYERSELSWISINQSMFYFMSAHSGEVICSQWGDIRQQQEKEKKKKVY